MFCTNCCADNSADDKFCTTCGAPLHDGPAAGGSVRHSGNNTTAQQETAVMQTVDAAGTASTPPAFVTRTAGNVNVRAAGADEGTATKPKRRMKKSTIILLAVFGVLIAGLVIAYFTLLNTVFSERNVVSDYVNAIANGQYAKATKLVDPGVSNNTRALFTDAVAKDPKDRIQQVSVGDITKDTAQGSRKHKVTVTYAVNGVKQSSTLTLEPAGKRFLIFDSWKITTPMIEKRNLSVPAVLDSVLVNGVAVKLAAYNTDGGSGTSYSLPSYPGMLRISAPKSPYWESETVSSGEKVNTSATLELTATEKLRDDILDLAKQKVKECVASSALSKTGCDFSNGSFESYSSSSKAYTDIKRTVTQEPAFDSSDSLDISAGTFRTSRIDVSIHYKYRYDAGDPWWDSDESDSGRLEGWFSVKDGKLSVKFSESDSGYY
ncbi:zinc ribbon domain-containing protein [Scardovia wiggsiae]|uniref:zinc ribbon domain-containing protein n=1 Tax=Scardovia wiggsiae TaxID=230143 RepID=UPI00374F73B9